MLSDDELRALADVLRFYATGAGRYTGESAEAAMQRAADYLRACADAKPVARIYTDAEMVHRDERWGRVQWIEPESELAEGTLLYTRAAPAASQAEPKRELLSDDEILDIATAAGLRFSMYSDDVETRAAIKRLARAIEREHGIGVSDE